MQMFRYLRRFPLLVAMPVSIALLLSIYSIVPEDAIAIPTNNRKGCWGVAGDRMN
jgi:hypothetical protein